MNFWPFRSSRAARDADRLIAQVSAASRNPALFGEGRVADTLEGRFELLTLFATLALAKLQAEAGAAPLAQEFSDRLFRNIDAGLREAGVGDLAVPKRMRRLAGDFLGRATAYNAALAAPADGALAEALQRNLGPLSPDFASDLASQARRLKERHDAQPLEMLFAADAWRLG